MKLVVKLKEPIPNLTPRHVRDFLASLNRKAEYNDIILWHKHIPPELIFTAPTQKGYFEIINYRNNVEMMEYFKKIMSGKELITECGSSRVEKVMLRNENFILPQLNLGIAVYTTRTPIIIASNTEEINEIRKIENDKEKLRRFLKQFILDSIAHTAKFYMGYEIPKSTLKEMAVDVSEIKYFYVPYPKKEVKLYFPSVRCRIISNFLLPRFVGYRIGYGFGELMEG